MRDFLKKFKDRLWKFDDKIGVRIIRPAYKLGIVFIFADAFARFLSSALSTLKFWDHNSLQIVMGGTVILSAALILFTVIVKLVIWRAICEFVEMIWRKSVLPAAE